MSKRRPVRESWPPAVCENISNLVRKPGAGNPHARFDEGDVETGAARLTAPHPHSTLMAPRGEKGLRGAQIPAVGQSITESIRSSSGGGDLRHLTQLHFMALVI